MKKTCEITCVALGVAMTLNAFSEDAVFPGSSGDILSEETWGGPVPTDRIKLVHAGTYTVSKDYTLNGLKFEQPENELLTMDLAVSGDPTVTLAADLDIPTARKQEFRGGVWNFNGHSIPYGGYAEVNNREVVLNGCVWENLDKLSLTYCGGGCQWTLKNGAKIQVEGNLKISEDGINYNNSLSVLSGSTLEVRGGFRLGMSGHDSSIYIGEKILIDGEGTFAHLATDGATLLNTIGANTCENALEVSNGALAIIEGGWGEFIGNSPYSCSNSLTVTSGAVVTNNAHLYLGNGGGTSSHGNMLKVLDGGVFWQRDSINISAGHDNGIVISNGTLIANVNDPFRCTAEQGGFVRFQGTHPQFTAYYCQFDYPMTFVYDFPAEGLDYKGIQVDHVPFATRAWGTLVEGRVKLRLNGVESMLERMKENGIRKETYVLADFRYGAGNDDKVSDETLAEWNAGLPEGAVVTWEDKLIVLHLSVKFGMAIILR